MVELSILSMRFKSGERIRYGISNIKLSILSMRFKHWMEASQHSGFRNLSILSMRFCTDDVVNMPWISESFQSSLWDSVPIARNRRNQVRISFQSSLWDSWYSTGSGDKGIGPLSILSVRFGWNAFGCFINRVYLPFNPLCEIRWCRWEWESIESCITFNPLCEIL